MISKTLEEHLRKEFRKQMNELADVVATGGVQDWANYKYVTGQIAGLAYAERIFLDAVDFAKEQADAD